MQHDCSSDRLYKLLELDLYKDEQKLNKSILAGKNEMKKSVLIKNPKNMQKCVRSKYQWLVWNLSPSTYSIDVNCNTLVGGDCEKGDYQIWLFTMDHWDPEFKDFHNEKQIKQAEKICSRRNNYKRHLTNNQALVVELQFLVDAIDVSSDAKFDCRITYGIETDKNGELTSTIVDLITTNNDWTGTTVPYTTKLGNITHYSTTTHPISITTTMANAIHTMNSK